MKHIFYLSLFLISTNSLSAQTLIVANNNPGAAPGVNVYTGSTALQDALAAAATVAPYDIIYVVPSTIAYGAITIDRGITIFGIGIRPYKDLSSKSLVGPISLNASDVRLSGLKGPVNGGVFIGYSTANVTYTNIIIENCVFREIKQNTSSTVLLDQVLIRNNVVFNDGWGGVEFYTTSNVTVTNNIIYCERASGSLNGKVLNVFNNLFVGNATVTSRAIVEADDCIFDHNIFLGAYPAVTSASTGNVWDDNLSFGSTNDVFSVGSYTNTSNTSNIESQDPLFVNMPMNFTWNDARDFTLQTGSPAILDLLDRTKDIGPSGGTAPFDNEGNLLPLIETVTIPAIIPVGSDLPVTIKAKGN